MSARFPRNAAFVSISLHAILDYAIGVLLIAAPWLLGFYRNEAETWTPVYFGIFILCYAALTRFPYAPLKLIPMRVNAFFDALSGAVLILSPFVFGFAAFVWAPHVLFGAVLMALPFVTNYATIAGENRF
jgi:hypothetical protein